MSGGVRGTTKARQHHPGLQQAWQAMRILRRFTVPELVITGPQVRYANASRYVRRLRQCGYVGLVKPRHLGQPGQHDVLQLLRNSGPQAPIPRHAECAVFDPNTGIVWLAGGVQQEAPPAAPAPRRLVQPGTRCTNTQAVVLACILEGRPPINALSAGASPGTLGSLMRGLRMRGLVDQAGALTAHGRAIAQQTVDDCERVCPPGWQP